MPINILGMIGVSAPATESTVHIVGGGLIRNTLPIFKSPRGRWF